MTEHTTDRTADVSPDLGVQNARLRPAGTPVLPIKSRIPLQWAPLLTSVILHAALVFALGLSISSVGSLTPPVWDRPIEASFTSELLASAPERNPFFEPTHPALVEHVRIPHTEVGLPLPELEAEPIQPNGHNGREDDFDGGTLVYEIAARSGGGGGDRQPDSDLGHLSVDGSAWERIRLKQSRQPISSSLSEGPGDAALPGTLDKSGGGAGLGNGSGAGAIGSTGDGSGAGSGRGGAGNGTGAGTGALTAGQGYRPAQGLYVTGGTYPDSARRTQHEGTATIHVEILADGRVGKSELAASSGHAELDAAALSASRQWTFRPATRDGVAVACWKKIPVRYVLVDR